MENVSDDTLQEMTKDIDRLQTITERFSKIGSIPKLDRKNIVQKRSKRFIIYNHAHQNWLNFLLKPKMMKFMRTLIRNCLVGLLKIY